MVRPHGRAFHTLYLIAVFLSEHLYRRQRLVGSLSETNYSINIGVLQTAHSIFAPWRAATRSDELFTVINSVLGKFAKPFLKLLSHTSQLLLGGAPPAQNSTLELRAQAMVTLTEIYYDLTCQDLPPAFEDDHDKFLGGANGVFLSFMTWDPPELQGDVSICAYSVLIKLTVSMRNSRTIRSHLFHHRSRQAFSSSRK